MILRTLCLALLVAPITALQVKKEEPGKNDVHDVKPKWATPQGIELLYQRPARSPVSGHELSNGILLYLHGCHGRATSMFTSEGKDGFYFDVCNTTKKGKCAGQPEEVLLRQKARQKGYLVAAVSGGVGNPRGCMNTNDVPRIQMAMQYLVEQEPDFKDKPVIMLGHSSGGRVLPELLATGAGIRNAQCIVPIADEVRVKGDSGAPLGLTPNYPEDVSAFFLHMHRDVARENNINENIHQLRSKGVRVGDYTIPDFVSVTPNTFNVDGFGLPLNVSTKLFKTLQHAQLLDGNKFLVRNPYAVGNNWQEAFKKEKGLVEEAGGLGNLQQYMDAAWGEHWMAGGRHLNQILDFCTLPGYKRVHEGGSPDFNLKSKVAEINQQSEMWKLKQEQISVMSKLKAGKGKALNKQVKLKKTTKGKTV